MSEFLRQAELMEVYNNSPQHSTPEVANDNITTLTLLPDSMHEEVCEQHPSKTESNDAVSVILTKSAEASPSRADPIEGNANAPNNSSTPPGENLSDNNDRLLWATTMTVQGLRKIGL